MIFLVSLIACKGDILMNTGDLGHIRYTLQTDYKMEGLDLKEAKIATGYPQRLSASLTASGWNEVGKTPYLVYHTSADDAMLVDSETILDGEMGVPGFTIQADTEGKFALESKLQDTLIDTISFNFVKPTELSILSWIRAPNSDEFTEESGDNISVSIGAQAAFIPIPQFDGDRIVGDLETEISINPPEKAVAGYNIESVEEGGVKASSNPASVYFVEAGDVTVCATDLVNDVESCQNFTVE